MAKAPKIDPSIVCNDHFTPMHAAIRYNHAECARSLLKCYDNIDLSVQNGDKEPVLAQSTLTPL